MGTWPKMERALDSRSESLADALVHPDVTGTWCTDPRLDQLLQAAGRPLQGAVVSEEHV